MSCYSSKDIESIAAAIDVAPAVIRRYAKRLHDVGLFVTYHGAAMPSSPSETRDRLLKISASARRLLKQLDLVSAAFTSDIKYGAREAELLSATRQRAVAEAGMKARTVLRHLGVRSWSDAVDGPAPDTLNSLNYADGTSLDAIVDLTALIGAIPSLLEDGFQPHQLSEIIKSVEELERIARDAADQALYLGGLVVPKGHHGDWAVNSWIPDMDRLYREVTGLRPTAWVNRTGASPFIRFLQAAGKPIGLVYSPDAWRRRVRAHLRQLSDYREK